jgi:flagellar motor switch protein FliM
LRGHALLVFDPNLIFLVVDNMFGGDGRFHTRVEGREFTQTEQRIIGKLINVAFDSLEKAWETVFKLQFEYVRSEMNPQFANIATPNEVVVTCTFDVEFGEKGGAVNICMPYSMIEPIREQLYSSMQGDHVAVDKRWQQTLARQVQSADVELTAVLGQANVTLDSILKMKVGDVIPIETGENITAQVDGVPVMECKYGVFNSQYALKVEKLLASQPSDITEGGNNG